MKPVERGFTLIEVLVALSVFSLAAMALTNLAGANTRTAGEVGIRAMAEVVAENHAIEAAAGVVPIAIGTVRGTDTLGGRGWTWIRKVALTPQKEMLRIDLAVSPQGSTQTVASLTVFRGSPP